MGETEMCHIIASYPLKLPLAQNVLTCSVNFRGGILTFVEAKDLGSMKRTLHVYDFLNSTGRLRDTPKHRSFAFKGHDSATASVPRPLLRRFVLLKSCSMLS